MCPKKGPNPHIQEPGIHSCCGEIVLSMWSNLQVRMLQDAQDTSNGMVHDFLNQIKPDLVSPSRVWGKRNASNF